MFVYDRNDNKLAKSKENIFDKKKWHLHFCLFLDIILFTLSHGFAKTVKLSSIFLHISF